MKKHLIAAAVAAAVAVPAMAQNVTLSGRLDQSVGFFKGNNQSETVLNSNVVSTSRLTFAGTEDLGGGLRAGFFLENGLTPDANAALTQFSRESNIFISGGFGEVRLGKITGWATDVDVFVNATGKLGGANNGLLKANSNVSMDGLGDNANNSIAYTSPNFQGLRVQIHRTQGETQGVTTGDATGLTARFTQGPLRLSASTFSSKATATTKAKQTVLGAGYDFGVVKLGLVGAQFDPNNTSSGDKRKYTMLTAGAPVSGAATAYLAYHKSKVEGGNTQDSTGVVLGVEYALSKRTGLYVEFADVDNKGSGANLIMSGMSTAAGGNQTANGVDSRLTSVGVRHFF